MYTSMTKKRLNLTNMMCGQRNTLTKLKLKSLWWMTGVILSLFPVQQSFSTSASVATSVSSASAPKRPLKHPRPLSTRNFKASQQIQPVLPAPLPLLPPPLSEQSLPYPERAIERPHALPLGLQQLLVGWGAAWSGKDVLHPQREARLTLPIRLLEFEFQQAYSNDITVIWNPFPFGILYQAQRTERSFTGVSWELGWNHLGHLGLKPRFVSLWKRLINSEKAIELRLEYWTFMPFRRQSSLWGIDFSIGPVFQEFDSLWIWGPRLRFMASNFFSESTYGTSAADIQKNDILASAAQYRLPLELWWGRQLGSGEGVWGKNSDINLILRLEGYGLPSSHGFVPSLLFTWSTRWKSESSFLSFASSSTL